MASKLSFIALITLVLTVAVVLAAKDTTQARREQLAAKTPEQRIKDYPGIFHDVRERQRHALDRISNAGRTAAEVDQISFVMVRAIAATLHQAVGQFEAIRALSAGAAADRDGDYRPSLPDEALMQAINFADVEHLISAMSVWENTAFLYELHMIFPPQFDKHINGNVTQRALLGYGVEFCRRSAVYSTLKHDAMLDELTKAAKLDSPDGAPWAADLPLINLATVPGAMTKQEAPKQADIPPEAHQKTEL